MPVVLGPGTAFSALALVALFLAACALPPDPVTEALGEQDRQAILTATQDALEGNKVGEGANWSRPESGHRGTVTPTRTYEDRAGRPCRDYQQTVTLGGKTYFAFDTGCRLAEGKWESLLFDGLAGANTRYGSVRRHGAPSYYDPFLDYPYYPGYGYPYGYGYRFHFGYGYRYRYGHGYWY